MVHRPLTIPSAVWRGGRPLPKTMMEAMAELPPGSANGHELQVMRNNDSQGRSQDFYIRGTEAERQSRENRGADAVGIGEGPPTHLWNI